MYVQGDTGGPLTCTQNSAYVAAGVASWGASGCSVDMPSVYTRLSYYADWIEEN